MIRIAVAVASTDALPTAFVVWRGIEESIGRANQVGAMESAQSAQARGTEALISPVFGGIG